MSFLIRLATLQKKTQGTSKMFIPTFISGALPHNLSSGVPLVIPAPPAGQYTMIYSLGATSGDIPDVSVKSDGNDLITSKILTVWDSDFDGEFHVATTAVTAGQMGQVPQILFDKDAIASVTVLAGANDIKYNYAHGILV